TMNNHIEQSLADLRDRALRYERPERYYNGEHDLKFATEKFENTFGTLFREFALNLCPVVCDAVRDKLRIDSFGVMSTGVAELGSDSSDSQNSLTRQIWHRNRMATRAGEVHKEALKTGDAYLIVWPDDLGRACLYPNRAANISVAYDEDSLGRIAYAAKAWRTSDKHVRLNLLYPDRIERYISKEKSEGALPEAKEFEPLVGTRTLLSAAPGATERTGVSAFPNPYGVVPVFHFANNADLGTYGRSELEAAIPVQDGLNKSVLDMLVAMEYSAFRQRWVAGIEVDYDAEGKAISPFKNGVDNLWVAGKDARFGDFEAAQLDQFLRVKDSFRVDIASVTGTPLHYFLQQVGEFASGESLKQSGTRFLAKVRDRQESFGQVWADAMSFALRIEGNPGTQLLTNWEDPSP
ncbi:MAG: phage portal protein, partial [Pyrinomonadaceae bacterium]